MLEGMYQSAVKGRHAFRDAFRKEKEKNWIPDNSQDDVRFITDLILSDDEGSLGSVDGLFSADFQTNENTFRVKYANGRCVKVIVKIEGSSTDVEPSFTTPRSTCG